MRRHCLGDKVDRLMNGLEENEEDDGEVEKRDENEDIAQHLVNRLRKKKNEQLLDDCMPGKYTSFPIEKMTKLIQKDYDKMKFEHDKKLKMEEIKTYEGERNVRLEELKKVGVELERRDLINV